MWDSTLAHSIYGYMTHFLGFSLDFTAFVLTFSSLPWDANAMHAKKQTKKQKNKNKTKQRFLPNNRTTRLTLSWLMLYRNDTLISRRRTLSNHHNASDRITQSLIWAELVTQMMLHPLVGGAQARVF